MKQVTIRAALQQVADYPSMVTDELIQVPVHELVARTLFEIANTPDAGTRGSMGRANKARKLILNYLVGKRRAGTHPAQRVEATLEFADLTAGAIPAAPQEPQEVRV